MKDIVPAGVIQISFSMYFLIYRLDRFGYEPLPHLAFQEYLQCSQLFQLHFYTSESIAGNIFEHLPCLANILNMTARES